MAISPPFIVINGQQQLSLAQAVRYLQAAGKLDEMIGEILRQFVLDQALGDRAGGQPTGAEVEAAIAQFRQQADLTDPLAFQTWLESQGLDVEALQTQTQRELQLRQLRDRLTEPHLSQYFIERKLDLDQVVLSRLAVGDRDLAEELYQQLLEGASFETLAQDYSQTGDRLFNGMLGLLSRGSLPDALRAAVDAATPGDVLPPLFIEPENLWCVFRLDRVLPATLDHPEVLEALRNELFDQWIMRQLDGLDIEVLVGE
ncbi:peptidylprolyl isomerase [Leptolyngbya sp. O-77]|uniref:foldase protein PrsA n=1 Tax=Leptolyngbya sp. O-77 TaxID=1080068 RepID=UPI00074D466C|nr:peptidylprolyl isomerase [Leptolyngbya sp. O-77]BAU42684.1 Chaperone SurA [Leptolyngbya sp. O-77]